MKKILFSTALLASVAASAQVDLQSTRFGITGALNYSRVQNAHNPSGTRYAPQFGITALVPVDQNNQFYIQPEVEYYGAGETGKDKDAKGTPGYNAVYADNYISVPLYFKGYFSEAESEFFGLLGPRFNFLVNQKVTSPSKSYYSVDGDPAYPGVNGKASPFGFAIGAGVGYSYKRKLEVAFKFDFGLSNTYKNLMKEPGVDPNISKKKTNQVLSLGLNYIFD